MTDSLGKRHLRVLSHDADRIVNGRNDLGTALEIWPDPAAILDSDFSVVDVNDPFCKAAGFDKDEAVGQPITKLARDFNLWSAEDGKRLFGKEPGATARSDVNSPGMSGYFSCVLTPIKADGEQPGAFLLALHDISDIKRKENALNQDMALLEDLLENANDMVQSVDPQGNFLYVNKEWRDTMGYTQEEVGRLNLKDILSKKCTEKCYSMFADVMRGKKLERVETTFITKDGREIAVEGNCNCRMENGKPVATRGIFRNITEKKIEEKARQELEEHMRQLQKLESLGLMAGGIAHDFNNLLMGILGFAELIQLREKPGTNIASYVKNIEQAARRAAELTNQMLAYSGHGRYKIDYLDLSQVITESQLLLGAAVSRKVQLEYDLQDDLPLVEADIDQIRQMLMSLVTNANEAIGDNAGLVSITTGTRFVDSEYLKSTYINEKLPEGQYVFMEVRDTGHGIKEEHLSRIFDPFFTTKFTGRGLGLAAVLGIVRGHHGAIRVDSALNEGTSITVLLPAYEFVEGGKNQQARKSLDEAMKPTCSVLLVEDEPTVRQVAKLMIEDLGYPVIEARDGREGYDAFVRNRDKICLVITDMLMSGINGMELIKKIRESGSRVPVILSSGYNKENIVSQKEEKELSGFIHKPYKEAQLHSLVKKVMQGE